MRDLGLMTTASEGGAAASFSFLFVGQPRDAKIVLTIVLAGGLRASLHLVILWYSDCRLTDAPVYSIALGTGTPKTTDYNDMNIEGGV